MIQLESISGIAGLRDDFHGFSLDANAEEKKSSVVSRFHSFKKAFYLS